MAEASRKSPSGADRWYTFSLVELPGRHRHWMFPVAALVLIAAGIWSARWAADREDARLRDALLQQVTAVARTLKPELFKALSFTEEDTDSPQFRRVRSQMSAYAEAMGLRGIYSMALRGESIVFGPESYLEGDPYASPPGTVYEKPPPTFFELFRAGKPFTAGPYADEYGTFVSGLAPVLDPLTGDVLAAIGIDTEHADWRASVARARKAPIVFSLALLAMLALGYAALGRRERLSAERGRRWRYVETVLCGAIMLALTAAASLLAHHVERRAREQNFAALALAQAAAVGEELRDIASRLNGMARFFEASDFVDRAEFRAFAVPITADSVAEGWVWAPRVTPDEVAALEAEAIGNGASDYRVWEFDPQQRPGPVTGRADYFPAFYIEPLAGHESGLGYDMGAEHHRRTAIDEAFGTGMPCATDVIDLFAMERARPGIFVFQPVTIGRQVGVVAVALRLDTLLRKTMQATTSLDSGTVAGLFQLSIDNAPAFLMSTSAEHCGGECWDNRFNGLTVTVPIFVFGKSYALLAHPQDSWLSSHRLRSGLLTAAAGVCITLLLTAFIAFLSNRQGVLEREIRIRTEALRDTIMRLEEAVKAGGVGLWDWDLGTNDVTYSVEWKRQIGYEDHEIVDTFDEWERRVHPEDLGPTLEKIQSFIADARSNYQVEFRFQHKDGSYRWILAQASVLRDASGQPVRTLGSHVDITERKRAEEELRRRESVLQRVFDILPVGLWFADRDGMLLRGNPMGVKIWGAEPHVPIEEYGVFKARRLPSREEIAPDDWALARTIREGVTIVDELLEIDAFDGQKRTVLNYTAPILDDRGTVDGAIVVNLDVTERIRAEEALRESERRYRLLAENTLDAIWQMDLDLRFTYVNQASVRLMGYTPEEWIGSRLLDHCDEASFARMAEIIAEEMTRATEHSGVVFETVMKRRDGTPIPVEIHGKIIFDAKGAPVGLQGVTRDITERKRAEEEQTKLQMQLVQSQKMESVGRLAGGVAHDFNNMLGVILGHAEMALEQLDPTQPIYEDLREIQKAAQRSADLTRQLLAFARKQTVNPKVLDLNDTVTGMLKMLQRLIGEDINLVWKPGASLGAVRIDPSQVDQMLANLSVNARDAIAGVGAVTIETQNVAFDDSYAATHPGFAPGQYVMLAVSDTGCGMDQETLKYLFEPFYTTKEIGKGTGLGLATVYGIVKQNDGFINVYSEPDRGTTVKIYLPRVREAAEEPPAPRRKQAVGGAETVLLVEDERSILELGKAILERHGYTVLTASTPDAATALSEGHDGTIDLLVTDVVMPQMNGRELRDRIAARRPGIKALYMSGYTANAIAHHGIIDPGIHFLQKPFSINDLAVKVREVLDQA